MQSTADYEVSFIAGGAWDGQFPGVVTVAVTPAVIEIFFEYDCTDGAHRTKLGELNFSPEVREHQV